MGGLTAEFFAAFSRDLKKKARHVATGIGLGKLN